MASEIEIKQKRIQSVNSKEIMLPVRDALDVLGGKWKIPIIISLFYGNKRFKEIIQDIPKLTDKSLSKELKELESNKLITRTVLNTFPPRVEYGITEHGCTLCKVIVELQEWGKLHRAEILKG